MKSIDGVCSGGVTGSHQLSFAAVNVYCDCELTHTLRSFRCANSVLFGTWSYSILSNENRLKTKINLILNSISEQQIKCKVSQKRTVLRTLFFIIIILHYAKRQQSSTNIHNKNKTHKI